MRVQTENAMTQTGIELLPLEFVDISDEMLERKLEYMRIERRKRSSSGQALSGGSR